MYALGTAAIAAWILDLLVDSPFVAALVAFFAGIFFYAWILGVLGKQAAREAMESESRALVDNCTCQYTIKGEVKWTDLQCPLHGVMS